METRSNVKLISVNKIQYKEFEKNTWSVTKLLVFVIISSVIVFFKMFTTKRKWEIYLHFDKHLNVRQLFRLLYKGTFSLFNAVEILPHTQSYLSINVGTFPSCGSLLLSIL